MLVCDLVHVCEYVCVLCVFHLMRACSLRPFVCMIAKNCIVNNFVCLDVVHSDSDFLKTKLA